jgi:hypothetical protein
LTTELTDMDDGTLELAYILPFEGQYELSIRMFEKQISGSPFKVTTLLNYSGPQLFYAINNLNSRHQYVIVLNEHYFVKFIYYKSFSKVETTADSSKVL